MRLAFVVSSSYRQSGKLDELVHAASQADLLGQRLSEPDAAFVVRPLTAERGLAEALEAELSALPEPASALLFCFSGYAVVSEEDIPSLLLDGERLSTLSLKRVRRLLTQHAETSLMVLDTVNAWDESRNPLGMVALLGEVVAGRKAGIHLIAANRPRDDASQPSAFGTLLALALDWHAGDQALSPEALFIAMRREESLFTRIPAADVFAADSTFSVLLPQAARATSLAPPPDGAAVVGGIAESDAATRADELLAAGEVERALDQYTLALHQLGPPPTPEHPDLYVRIALALDQAKRTDDALLYCEAALDLDPKSIRALSTATDLAIQKEDAARTLAFLERWLALDPGALAAAERAAPLLAKAGAWEDLAALYESVLPRATDARAAAELALKVDEIYTELVGNPGRALPTLEHAATIAPDDARVRLRLANLYEHRAQPKMALAHLLPALRADPRHVAGYRTALRLFERARDADGAFRAAAALEALGEADVNESLLAGAHRPSGLLSARGALPREAWGGKRLCPERDSTLDTLFEVLGDAIVQVGLETAQRKRRLAEPHPSTAQDPATSTATLVKTLAWAARLLGMDVPRVHVIPDLPAPFLLPPSAEPLIVASRSLGSGMEPGELAFLWGRQLVFLRPEHRAFLFFPSTGELAALVIAALSVGGVAELPLKKLTDDAKLFARGLKRHLGPEALERLRGVAEAFPHRDSAGRVLSWVRSVESAASRAGLLASGDVETAVKMTRKYPMGGLGDADAQVFDLVAYSVGHDYGALRVELGVSVGSGASRAPPPLPPGAGLRLPT